ICYSLLYILSLMPMRCLYIISYITRWVLFDVIKYRRDVIRQNLTHAFPSYSFEKIREIERAFQQGFCDQWLEVVKLLSISTPRLNKMIVADWSVFKQFEDRNVHVLLGHQFNWEIANLVCQLNTRHPFYGIYLPLSSPAFDRLMNHIRSRTGS